MSRISPTIDLERPGKQSGFLRLPYSSHDSAYGWLPIPVICIANGTGPTVLLAGGNHGDEYEGQIALLKLSRTLAPEKVQGRLIILPAANLPAAAAGRRVSPLDGGNLNRSFPGDPSGSPTEMLAHFIESKLIPLCDYIIDLHAGGSSLHYQPTILARLSTPTDKRDIMLRSLRAFGAPFGLIFRPLDGEDRTMSAAAERHGVVYLCPELGGSGTVSRASLALAEGGLRRALAEFGVIAEDSRPPSNTRLVTIGGVDNYVYAPEAGLFEPFVEPGEEVRAGQAAGLIHCVHSPWRDPTPAHFQSSGVALCRRVPTRTERGDCLYQVGTDLGLELE
jgi:predicted deacylase